MESNLHNTGNNMEERLWNYIDGTLPDEERSVIESLLDKQAAWKTKYQELLEVNQLLKSSELEVPSLRFTRNVMEEIAKLHVESSASKYINKRIIWGIGLFFILMITGFLIYGFGQVEWNTGENNTIADTISKIRISKFFTNTWINVFMMINVVLGLFLLDNYLGAKRKAFRKES
jgi:hypothetical protein